MNKVSPGQNETFHIIIPQAINKSLCRQMPKVYDISGRYHSVHSFEPTKSLTTISVPSRTYFSVIIAFLQAHIFQVVVVSGFHRFLEVS